MYDGNLKAPFQISATSLHGEEVISPELKSMRDALDCKGKISNSNSEPNREIKRPATKPSPSPPSKLPPPIQSPPPTEKKADTTTTPRSNSSYPSSPNCKWASSCASSTKFKPPSSGRSKTSFKPLSSGKNSTRPESLFIGESSTRFDSSSCGKSRPSSPPPTAQVLSGTSRAPTIRSRRCTLVVLNARADKFRVHANHNSIMVIYNAL
uniref:AlNc14C362G11005 protein n=1 Tax=Albugo laibachii Nc14 TaxID=890382 RepID=F0WXR9_9STRA|nr:AlNc14C362G11005 [Albugo laibachii Nc14]|eukprot:CCA26266.1 AlNc14C362G11005 [Albugo laibachii Nc14]